MSFAATRILSPLSAMAARGQAGLDGLVSKVMQGGLGSTRRLFTVLEVLLVVACADQAVRIAWRLISPPSLGPAVMPNSTPTSIPAGGRTGLPLAAKIDLFADKDGARPDQNVAANVAAPDTSLNLTLVGVRAERSSDGGSAIIQRPDGTQDVYFPGQPIIDGVTLERVLADRAIIRRNGLAESLRFDQTATLIQATSEIDAPQASATVSLGDFGSMISGFEISLVPDGGVAVRPGRQPAAFSAAGLAAGDIIRRVNGESISTVPELMAAIARIAPGRPVTVELERDGDAVTKTYGGPT